MFEKTMTLYQYAYQNPVKYIDPTGMSPEDSGGYPPSKNWDEFSNKMSNIFKGVDSGTKQRFQLEPVRGDTKAGLRDTKAGRISNKTGKPVGDWVIRADQAHKGAPEPHLNVNPKATGVADPHTAIPGGAKTLKALESSGKTLDAIGKVAKPVAIVIDAARIGNAIHEDGCTIGNNTIITSSSVAGGWAGTFAGAAIGAEGGAYLGGVIGGFFGGVGAVPGAAVGGFVGGLSGGIVGSFGGSWLAEEGAKELVK